MPHTRTNATLNVPGARIYYETQGTGPVLLIIPGGPQDAGVFTELAEQLASHYTVVAYDPRGNSRSTFDGEAEALDLDVQADDAARLIQAIDAGPAYVFGTSGGAQIGLNLAARHPGLVRALVAHEPPAVLLLDDPSAALASDQALYDTYRRDGVEAAMQQFFAEHGLGGDAGSEDAAPDNAAPDNTAADEPPPAFDMSPEAAETFARVSGNFEYWLAHGMLPLSRYRPDIEALRRGEPRVVVGIGEQSAGQIIHEMSTAVARALGTEPVSFPGDHMGFEPHADIFAATLHRIFSSH